MNKRYQIFISSTYEDLKEERQKVTQAILKLYHFPIGMEMFHADNEEQWIQIKNTIDMSDYYILIVGRCCGTLIEKEKISYTEKEYNYALEKGIPILAFVIADDAKKEKFKEENNKQRAALKKFLKRVMSKPCEFWHTPNELAYQVVTTLSMKFREDNRNGWIQYNPYGIIKNDDVEDIYVGRYNVIYYSELRECTEKQINSLIEIQKDGSVVFYNNIGDFTYGSTDGIIKSEYKYHGQCDIRENIIYLFLKNDVSNERAIMYLIKSVGKAERFIGLFMAMTSNMVPVCLKIACFKDELYKRGINYKLLNDILTSQNINWKNNMLTIEDKEKYLFYSDEILKKKNDKKNEER